jgi:hypothetical protein
VHPALGAAPSAPLVPRHQAVLDLGPVGYWPADDGAGEQLRDLVWFDRALAPAEVARVHSATTPERDPVSLPAVAAHETERARHGERAPRVEDLRRNALLRALLDLAPDAPRP